MYPTRNNCTIVNYLLTLKDVRYYKITLSAQFLNALAREWRRTCETPFRKGKWIKINLQTWCRTYPQNKFILHLLENNNYQVITNLNNIR